jgi:phage terminase large subunit-like protein
MKRKAVITVQGRDVAVISSNNEDYISLTDMIKAKDGDFFVSDWLRNRNTIEFWVFGKIYIILILIMANSP